MKTFQRDRIKEADRIKKVREKIMEEHPEFNKTGFASEIGYELEAYEKIEKRGANASYLNAIHLRFKVNANHILTGEDPMFLSNY